MNSSSLLGNLGERTHSDANRSPLFVLFSDIVLMGRKEKRTVKRRELLAGTAAGMVASFGAVCALGPLSALQTDWHRHCRCGAPQYVFIEDAPGFHWRGDRGFSLSR